MEIKFWVDHEEDDAPVRGNAMVSGDEVADRTLENAILMRLRYGDLWAWARVTVCASIEIDGQIFVGKDHLSGCSYRDEVEFKADGYFEQMKREAVADLCTELKVAIARGKSAEFALAEISK